MYIDSFPTKCLNYIYLETTPWLELPAPFPRVVMPLKNVRKIFVTTKFWQIFKLSNPIVMRRGA